MNFLKKALLHFILPVIVIIIGFNYNALIGVAFLLAYILYIAYSNLPSIYSFIGNIKYTKDNMKEAIEWFGRAYNTGRAKPRLGVSYGYLLLKDGNVEESENVFEQLLKKVSQPDDKMLIKSNLGLVLWKKGRLDDAIELLEDVLSKYKTSNIYGSLGYLLIVKGDLEKALRFNLEAYDYNNSNSIILDNLGETYYHMGDYDKSEEIFTQLMEKKPSFPEAYYNYALVLMKKEQYDKALEVIKNALNYKTTFLSAVTREEIETKIAEIETFVKK